MLFSALTTTTAFGSLALSRHPGTAGMGALLTIGLVYTLVCTLFVLPALLGPAKRPSDRHRTPSRYSLPSHANHA
ncbi:MAG: MMPL family transporter [Pseudomonadota bacterium]